MDTKCHSKCNQAMKNNTETNAAKLLLSCFILQYALIFS